ncbi:DUF4062 domain-containing protein [Streptomyces werraensis]|uniref:DUF4062 domain-containing protein n=1 Tax=Streptomyces werraensis TaxID=68284 RepID=UPI00342D1C44
MAANVREVVVFIASPGDVTDEREAVRKIAESLNNLHSSVSTVRIRVTGWEHVQPEHERPQEVINELVDECDVFIGVLYKKWGSPTGHYDSGFEEEYERALKRRKEAKAPDIALYFKRVEQDFLADPGEQLKKVLQFQRKFQEEHSALYREFSSIDDFKAKIYEYLNRLLILTRKHVDANAGSDGKLARTPQMTTEVTHLNNPDPARQAIASSLSAFSELAIRGHTDGDLDRDRLLLVALAFQPDMVSIPMHALNRLYGRRAELHLSAMEYKTVIWTLAESYGSAATKAPNVATPAWYFLDARSESGLVDLLDMLVSLAFDEHEDFVVRCGALRLLSLIKAKPSQLWMSATEKGVSEVSLVSPDPSAMDITPIERWEYHLNSTDSTALAIDYMANVAEIRDVPLIQELARRVESRAMRSRLLAISNYLTKDFNALMALSSGYVVSDSWEEAFLLEGVEHATEEELLQLVNARTVPIRLNLAAIAEISMRRALGSEEIVQILTRKNEQLTTAVFDAASKLDTAEARMSVLEAVASLGDSDAVSEHKPRLLALTYGPEELRRLAADTHRVINAWPALTLVHSAEPLATEARSILDTDCASHMDVKELEQFGYKGAVLAYVRAKVRLAALEVLDQLGDSHAEHDNDLQRVRAELHRSHIITREQAARTLIKWGTEEDAPAVLEVANKVRDPELFLGAIKLGGIRLARRFLKSDDAQEATLGAAALIESYDIGQRELQELLYSDHPAVRLRAVREVRKRCSDEQLAEFIEVYRSRASGYYYDVVAAIDRMLYAPLPLAEHPGADAI